MPGYVIAPKAQLDLDDIWDAISDDDVAAADRLANGFQARFRLLAHFPRLGRSRDDILNGLRCFPHRRYLILYRLIDGGVEVVHVVHGARDIARLFDDGEV
ncbi:plasmid stabilization protein [Candidatus Poribacteria bacterium]|jgi:toxin ParE1/3/4|nr:plasmid stabilization protein [Candidatus Poribacteria bacterium]